MTNQTSQPSTKPYYHIVTESQRSDIIRKAQSKKYLLKTIAASYGLTVHQVKTIINNYNRQHRAST